MLRPRYVRAIATAARALAAATPDRAVDVIDVIDATGGALRGAGADFDAMDDDTRDTAYDCMTAALLALGARVD